MALFPDSRTPYSVYDYIDPTWENPTAWISVGTVLMRVEPVAANEEILNKQDYQGVSEIGFLDMQYDGMIKPNTYLVRQSDGTVYQNRGVPEKWEWLIPYIMVKLERPQSPVTIPPST